MKKYNGVFINIEKDESRFIDALKIATVQSNFHRIGDYVRSVLEKDENFLKVLDSLK